MSRILVTSALPYANGDIHIGHLVEYLMTDIYVRAMKLAGEDVVYMCASDSHGTPIEVNARKKGMTPEEMVAEYNRRHLEDFTGFGIEFDRFYTTHSDETRIHAERIFSRLTEGGLIYKKDVEQYYCEEDKRFLPDRFVKGTCPRCGAEEQYGDSCEKCGATYDPTDLKDSFCVLCQKHPTRRSSLHYFVDLEKARPEIAKWVADEKHLHPEMRNWLEANFLKNELRPWDISRDAPYFGFRIPGETDKFFYVWLDAPVGYIGTTQKYCDEKGLDFAGYWEKGADCRIVHVIGKDITYFHTLFWPAMLHTGGYNLPERVQIHGFLTVNGEKMSKSRGTSITARTYLKHLDPQFLRFYYASKLGPGPDDLDLNLEEFALRVNAELVNKIANLASRSVALLSKRLEGKTGEPDPAAAELAASALEKVPSILAHYRNFEFSRAMREICAIAEVANKYLQDAEPFKLVGAEPEKARAILSSALAFVKSLAILIGPVLPLLKERTEKMFQATAPWTFADADFALAPAQLTPFDRLVDRVDPAVVEAMIEDTRAQFAPPPGPGDRVTPFKEIIEIDDFGKLDLRVATVLTAIKVEGSDKLLQVTVDLGREKRNIFAGLAAHIDPATLVGRQVVVLANLKPRKMRFGVSEGMILAAEDIDGKLSVLGPVTELFPGATIS
ncbi:methionine--tRNA ligase [Myxococcota bacterium]|nr:methionine--tRNA ligase [Myxococcota bacterium]